MAVMHNSDILARVLEYACVQRMRLRANGSSARRGCGPTMPRTLADAHAHGAPDRLGLCALPRLGLGAGPSELGLWSSGTRAA